MIIVITQNIMIFQGNYQDIAETKQELTKLKHNKKISRFYRNNTTKYLKKLNFLSETGDFHNDLRISFTYPKTNINELIPPFAIREILLDYMRYIEAAIVLDSYRAVKYERNTKEIVVDEKPLSHKELLDIIYADTIKNRKVIDVLTDFTENFYNKCINNPNDLYPNNKEKSGNQEPTPFALFFVTFGIIGIIVIFLLIMGYI